MSWFMAFSQTTIRMEFEDGVYKVPCTVNGVKMKFVFDTGASNVCISMSMAKFMLDGDYLSVEDIIGTGQSVVADGRIVDHVKIILRDIEIGGMFMHNVEAIVVDKQDSPLLLGQSAIQKLGPVTIDGDKLIILDAVNDEEAIKERCSKWFDIANENYFDDDYEKTIEYLLKIKENCGELNEYCYYMLSISYYSLELYSDCIKSNQEAFRKIQTFENEELLYWMQFCMAGCYDYGFNKYYDAINWYEKSITLTKEMMIYCNKSEDTKYYSRLEFLYSSVASCYGHVDNYGKSYEMFKQAMFNRLHFLGQQVEQLAQGLVNDEKVGEYLYAMGLNCYLRYDIAQGNAHMIASAKCGYWEAIDECRMKGLKY